MKKIAKISLVAAIAVAGFTTANAQPLEEAIKNVEVTGSVVYRYNDYKNDAKDGSLWNAAGTTDNSKQSTSNNDYKVALGLSSKVNDDVKFNSRFLVADANGDFAATSTGPGLDSQADSDANPGVTLSQANFAFTGVKNTTVIVGKQGLATPWTVAIQADGNEQTGTGILALSNVGPVTLAGGFFNQTNLNNSSDVRIGGATESTVLGNYTSATKLTAVKDASGKSLVDGTDSIATVGTIANIGIVTADAWYLTYEDVLNTYTLGAKAATKVSNIDLTGDLRYVSLKANDRVNPDNTKDTIIKGSVTADAGLIDANIAFAKTGKDGGLTALDNDATATLLGWNLTANGKTNAKYIKTGLGIDILSNLNLSANYGQIKWDEDETTDAKEKELYGQLKYVMSKNLSTYVRYGTYTKEFTDGADTLKTNDEVRGRLQVAYTF